MKTTYHPSLKIAQNKMCFFDFKKTDIHLLYIVRVLFWQSSDYPIQYQSPEEPAQIVNGKKPAAESNTSPSEKHSPACARVSVLLVLLSLWS